MDAIGNQLVSNSSKPSKDNNANARNDVNHNVKPTDSQRDEEIELRREGSAAKENAGNSDATLAEGSKKNDAGSKEEGEEMKRRAEIKEAEEEERRRRMDEEALLEKLERENQKLMEDTEEAKKREQLQRSSEAAGAAHHHERREEEMATMNINMERKQDSKGSGTEKERKKWKGFWRSSSTPGKKTSLKLSSDALQSSSSSATSSSSSSTTTSSSSSKSQVSIGGDREGRNRADSGRVLHNSKNNIKNNNNSDSNALTVYTPSAMTQEDIDKENLVQCLGRYESE